MAQTTTKPTEGPVKKPMTPAQKPGATKTKGADAPVLAVILKCLRLGLATEPFLSSEERRLAETFIEGMES